MGWALLALSIAQAAQLPFVCDATPAENRLSVVGPMIGIDPVWMVDAGWSPREPAKTIWVLSRQATGSLHVTGHRLDGPGVLKFRFDFPGPITDALDVVDPWHRSMIPGGASREVMAAYAFVHGDVAYPAAGCWELTATVGNTTVRIVRDLR